MKIMMVLTAVANVGITDSQTHPTNIGLHFKATACSKAINSANYSVNSCRVSS